MLENDDQSRPCAIYLVNTNGNHYDVVKEIRDTDSKIVVSRFGQNVQSCSILPCLTVKDGCSNRDRREYMQEYMRKRRAYADTGPMMKEHDKARKKASRSDSMKSNRINEIDLARKKAAPSHPEKSNRMNEQHKTCRRVARSHAEKSSRMNE